ncbi:putative bifunctional diguanylate cyclase/phosphodiesterase [Methylobacterium nonmethylotrophicum]|uniref:EAL domain-containing protein n=1 Tax=Methylobacterium nonmethylotrophicum TaxID=1141884 RepID=A0A4Z0NTK5_9HYPH|nr:bifunctional diguanylate cyclase/phosphodiesterase [Methylobacterium nonmethylotrophicum]TGE00224.1 EAL domain-containing protein [Methylobacterium nonmethylotrophicum]
MHHLTPTRSATSGQDGSGRRGQELRLERRLRGAAFLIAAGLLALTAIVVAPSIAAYRDGQHNLMRISRLRQILEAANRLSAERGPSNVLMAIAPGSDPAAQARLAAFRAASDGALAGLVAPARSAGAPEVPARFLEATAAQLDAARRDVDRVAGLPPAERRLEDVGAAVARMIAVVDIFQDAVAWEIREIGRADPALVGAGLIGHVVSDLREYGGRIGSAIIPAVAVRQPLTPERVAEAVQMRGRILELMRLLRGQSAFGPGQPLEGLLREVETTFVEGGLGLITAAIAEGQVSGRYTLGADALTHRYVPTLKPVEALRDRYLAGMVEGFAAERDAVRARLVAVACGTVTVLSLLAVLLQSLRASVLRPLLVARETVVALSQGTALPPGIRPPPGGAPALRITEIRRLFDGLAVLEERMGERARLIATLRRQAETDGLTGMSNRRGLARAMAQVAEAPDRAAAAALMIDLDGFKTINDTLGHEAGDDLIRQAGARLAACIARHDIVDGLVARMGGDEFAVLLPGCGDAAAAIAVAEALLHGLSEPFPLGDRSIHLGASIGIALSPLHGPLSDALLACADMALYEAKRAGRHCHRLFTPAMREATLVWTARQQELPQALAAGEFALFYQPQVCLRTRRIVGAEALIRWRHPQLGLLAPAAFLAPLEASPLAAPVGRWVLREACAQAAAWRAAGAPDLRVGVNLFGAQFHAASLVDEVRAALAETGLPGSALELEITETIILQHDEALIAPLRALRDLGIGLAFDDYGTGYASLSLLKRFPLTRLKIDRSFVQGMEVSSQDRAIVRSVLSLGHSLGLGVIAEGVETEAMCGRLRAKGCKEAQGYLFGRPMPPEDFAALCVPGERPAALSA